MNFTDQLAALNRGRFFADIEEKLIETLEAVQRLKAKGTIDIKLTVSMVGQEEDQVNIQAKVTHKKPERAPASTVMFINQDGSLQVDDPKQKDFGELIEVPHNRETGEVIEPNIAQNA